MTILLGHVGGASLGAGGCSRRTVRCSKSMGGVGEWGAGVGRVQVHPPTHCRHAASDSPHSRQLPFLPQKTTSGKQNPAVGGGVVLGSHGDRFKVLLVAPRHPATHS